MDDFTALNAIIISLPILVTIFYTFYLLRIGRNQPELGIVSRRTVLILWLWFLSACAIAYYRVFSHEVSFENGDLLIFSTYATLISVGPLVALVIAKLSDKFYKLLSTIPAYVLVASQIIRLGGYHYWEAYKAGEIPFNLGVSIAGMDVFLALCTPFLAYALFNNYQWAARATVVWAFLGIFDVLNGTVQMIMGFLGAAGMSSASINMPLSNLIELYQVGIGIIIHVLLINRFIKKNYKVKQNLSIIAIIGISAFAGNMINIGLSYGIHWQSLEPIAFMESFKVDFPLLLGPTTVTLMPAFITTLWLVIITKTNKTARRYWIITFAALMLINIQTVIYHLPINLDFMELKYASAEASSKLQGWIIFHWIRVVVAIGAAVFAIKAFAISKNN